MIPFWLFVLVLVAISLVLADRLMWFEWRLIGTIDGVPTYRFPENLYEIKHLLSGGSLYREDEIPDKAKELNYGWWNE